MASIVESWVIPRERAAGHFERLFIEEYGRVVGVALRVLGDPHAAEDVAQEVFYAFYRSHDPCAPYAAAWLHRAAAHTALNVIRGNKRRETRERAERLLPSAEPDPQDAVTAAEQRAEVRSALGRLPEKYGTVLALRYSGLSYAEVAQALGVKIGQVGTLLRRAEAALKKEMDHAASK